MPHSIFLHKRGSTNNIPIFYYSLKISKRLHSIETKLTYEVINNTYTCMCKLFLLTRFFAE